MEPRAVSPKDEVEGLMHDLFPLARQKLSKYEVFIPFAGTITCDGTQQIHSPYDPNMGTLALSRMLEAGLRESARRGEIRATVLFYDGYITPPGSPAKVEALMCLLDHKEDYSVVVAFPYRRVEPNQVVVEEPVTLEGKKTVFLPKRRWKFW